jgi:hypothetical protein
MQTNQKRLSQVVPGNDFDKNNQIEMIKGEISG